MADKLLTELIKAAGTRDEFVENYNGVINDIGDQVMTELAPRTCKYWVSEGVPPAHSPIWILATVLRMGMPVQRAIELYPDLQPALELARFVVNLAETRKTRAA
jgi:hypothetical protein